MVYRLLERHVASMAGGSPWESADAESSGLAQQHESLVQKSCELMARQQS